MSHRWKIKKWIAKSSVCSVPPNNKLYNAIQRPKDLEYFGIYFFGFEPIYNILFVCFSILSLAFSGYWYCGCLIYVFLNIEVLEQVLTALRRSG